MPIINSLLDDDLYKFSMQMAVLHSQPSVEVSYKFVLRNKGIKLGHLITYMRDEIKHLCSLKFTEDELEYLSTLSFIKKDYINYLRGFSLNYSFVKLDTDKDGNLDIRIKGPWFHTILFEVPVLAIINEVYFRDMFMTKPKREEMEIQGVINLENKLDKVLHLKNFKFADFGTRRRFRRDWHETIVKNIIYYCRKQGNPSAFVGTSNVYLAKQFGIKPIGTMAHEWFQGFQRAEHNNIISFQKTALDTWAHEYRGDLGIALTDTISMDAFLKDFDLYFAKLFDGCRHDSGDPFEWGEKLIDHYVKLGIDPKTKFAVFSDGLDMNKAIRIYSEFNGRINVSFGIGTNLTNDVGAVPLQIVMKMYEYDGRPVAKLSDNPSKSVCEDKKYIEYLKSVFNYK